MDWLNAYAPDARRDEPIGRLTWYKLGGSAQWFYQPRSHEQLAQVIRRAHREHIPVRVLGGGANVLVADTGVNGIVLRLDQPAFRDVFIDGEVVRAGAGADLMALSRRVSAMGLAGMEGLAGIPGSVGGATRMNAGGKYGSIADVVESIEVMTPLGDVESWTASQVGFRYRGSAVGANIVLSTSMRLHREDSKAVIARYRQYMEEKLESQPMAEHSAGCVFKNPPNAPAGRLIDEAGFKGLVCGRAMVSVRHANFIVAERGASAGEVLKLIDEVREGVRAFHGVELETEIDVWR